MRIANPDMLDGVSGRVRIEANIVDGAMTIVARRMSTPPESGSVVKGFYSVMCAGNAYLAAVDKGQALMTKEQIEQLHIKRADALSTEELVRELLRRLGRKGRK